MKQMLFMWPFWSFWLLALVILVLVLFAMFVWPYPLLFNYLPSRKGSLRIGQWGGGFILSVIIIFIVYLALPMTYACQALEPSGTLTCQSGTITIGGSTALNPFIHAAIAKYESKCPGAQINNRNEATGQQQIQGSLAGLKALSQGTAGGGVDIGTSDVFIASYTTFDPNDYQDYQVAVVKYVVIVNKPASVNQNMPSNLKSDDLKQIYSKGDTSTQTWDAYGGPQGQQIVPFARDDQNSGTEVTFRQHVIQTNLVAVDNLHKEPDPQSIIKKVETTKGAIGYVSSYDWIRYGDPGKAQLVNINGYSDANANIEINNYLFWNIEHLYTQKGNKNPLVKSFIDFLGSANMVSNLDSLDYIQLPQVPQNALQTRCPVQN